MLTTYYLHDYLLLTAYYLLLWEFQVSLLTTSYFLLTAYCLLLSEVQVSLLTTYCLLRRQCSEDIQWEYAVGTGDMQCEYALCCGEMLAYYLLLAAYCLLLSEL